MNEYPFAIESLFITLLNMSITASWLALVVVLLRAVLKKAPKWIMVALWGLVAVRLLCPFTLESALSLIPTTEPVPTDIVYATYDTTVNVATPSPVPSTEKTVDPVQTLLSAASVMWGAGAAAMLGFITASYWGLRRRLREATPFDSNVWVCDHIDTPFILGVLRPRIYLPSTMKESDREYVLAHERAHLRRGDHLWKPLGFFLLSVHWFNPLLWVAYVLLCKDIELACDEKVMRAMGESAKAPYAAALINCSAPRNVMIAACPLAFGEVAVKERVKSVLSFKKPAVWILIAAILVGTVVMVCFLTDPQEERTGDNAMVTVITTTATSATTTQSTAASTALPAAITTTTAPATTTTAPVTTTTVPITTHIMTTTATTTTIVRTQTLPSSYEFSTERATDYVEFLSLSPDPVRQGETITVRVAAGSEDEIHSLTLMLYCGDDKNTVYDSVPFTLTEGDAHNGVYTATYTLPQDAAATTWYVGVTGIKIDHSVTVGGIPHPQSLPIIVLPGTDADGFTVIEA